MRDRGRSGRTDIQETMAVGNQSNLGKEMTDGERNGKGVDSREKLCIFTKEFKLIL